MKRSLVKNTTRFKTDMLPSSRRKTEFKGEVDKENGIIKNMLVVQAGEAKGHGVMLDEDFVAAVAAQGNKFEKGVKCRFGHPSMCATDSIGTFLGRFKNFRVSNGDCVADLHLSDIAKKAPSGDLYDYILGMASKESDQFGNSIVFAAKDFYTKTDGIRDKKTDWNAYEDGEKDLFIELGELHACDCVDTPAATEGAFLPSFSQLTNFDSWAVEAEEYFNTNPELKSFLMKNKNSFVEFLNRQGITFFKKPLEIDETNEPLKFSFAATATNEAGEQIQVTATEDKPEIGKKLYTEGGDVAADGVYNMPIEGQDSNVTVTDGTISAIDAVVADPITDPNPTDEALSAALDKHFNALNDKLQKQFDAINKRLELLEMSPQDRAAFAKGQKTDKSFTTPSSKKSYEMLNEKVAASSGAVTIN